MTARPTWSRATEGRHGPTAAGASTTTTSWSPATRPASTSSGSGTTSLADSDNLPPPDVIAQEIVEDLEAALEQFRLIEADLAESSGAGVKHEKQ